MANENCFGKSTYETPASFSTVRAELVGSTTPRSSSVAVAAAVVFVPPSTSTGDGHRREMCSNGSLSACTSVKHCAVGVVSIARCSTENMRKSARREGTFLPTPSFCRAADRRLRDSRQSLMRIGTQIPDVADDGPPQPLSEIASTHTPHTRRRRRSEASKLVSRNNTST